MRSVPEDDGDRRDLAELNAEPWMVDLLSLNPEYVFWGPGEDYMSRAGGDGWSSSQEFSSWSEFGPWGPDDLNECVNFYFELHRASKPCAACDESGLNPATKAISDDWYDFAGTGRRWDTKLTQHEVDALVECGRLWDFTRTWSGEDGWKDKEPACRPTAKEVNAWASGRGLGHDSINQWICVQARAEREGVYGRCSECGGSGSLWTSPSATVQLTLWYLHPRKGASRGVRVASVRQEELPAIKLFLAEAARRNAERFKAFA